MARELRRRPEEHRAPIALERLLEMLSACTSTMAETLREPAPADLPACRVLAEWVASIRDQVAARGDGPKAETSSPGLPPSPVADREPKDPGAAPLKSKGGESAEERFWRKEGEEAGHLLANALVRRPGSFRTPLTLRMLLGFFTSAAEVLVDQARDRYRKDLGACQEWFVWITGFRDHIAARETATKPARRSVPVGGRKYSMDEGQALYDVCTVAESEALMAGRLKPHERTGNEWRRLKRECTPAEWRSLLEGGPDPDRVAPTPVLVEAMATAWSVLEEMSYRDRERMADRWASRLPEGAKLLLRERTPWALLGLKKTGGLAK